MCFSPALSLYCRAAVWCCWCNNSSPGCQLWSNLHKGINIAQFSLLTIFLFQCVPIRVCRRVHLTSHWLLDPILTIMSLCLFSVWFNPLIHRHHPFLGHSWPENIFSERKKKISGGRSGNSFCPDDDVGKVSWLTLIQNCLYTWDTDNNDNIIADILHNIHPTFIQSQLWIHNTNLASPPGWVVWVDCLDCQLSHCVNLVKYFNKESYVAVENVSHHVNWNIFNGLHSNIFLLGIF